MTFVLFHALHLPFSPVIALLPEPLIPYPATETSQLNLLQWLFCSHWNKHTQCSYSACICFLFVYFFEYIIQIFNCTFSLFSRQPKKINTTLYSWRNNVVEVINTEFKKIQNDISFEMADIFAIWQRNMSHCLFLYVELYILSLKFTKILSSSQKDFFFFFSKCIFFWQSEVDSHLFCIYTVSLVEVGA